MALRAGSRYELLIRPTMGRKEPSLMTEAAPIFDIVIAGGGRPGWRSPPRSRGRSGGATVALVDPAPDARERARRCARSPSPRGRDACWEDRRLGGDRAQRAADPRDGDHGRRTARRGAPRPSPFRGRSDGEPLAHMAFNDDVVRGARRRSASRLGVARLAGVGRRAGRRATRRRNGA